MPGFVDGGEMQKYYEFIKTHWDELGCQAGVGLKLPLSISL